MSKAWMPFYVADYLGDTGHLTYEEHGVYLLAILHYWQTGKPLPINGGAIARANAVAIARANGGASNQQLMMICRCPDPAKFAELWETVSKLFTLTPEGWRHKRIDTELEKARIKTEKLRANGIKGGQKTIEKWKEKE
jgi:uncharacterized protein YdaU (DUF1376 family)